MKNLKNQQRKSVHISNFKRINLSCKNKTLTYSFYPSSVEKYKKVDFLINAFKLYNENFPDSKLYLTIDKKYKSLNSLIDTINEKER